MDEWVTQGGSDPLPLEEEHCSAVEVTEEDIQNSVKFVPSLSAVVSVPGHASSSVLLCQPKKDDAPSQYCMIEEKKDASRRRQLLCFGRRAEWAAAA